MRKVVLLAKRCCRSRRDNEASTQSQSFVTESSASTLPGANSGSNRSCTEALWHPFKAHATPRRLTT